VLSDLSDTTAVVTAIDALTTPVTAR